MRKPKIAFIGAGSTVFAKNLIGDLLSYTELAAARLTLFDIDEKRLAESEIVARRINQALGTRATIEATTDRATSARRRRLRDQHDPGRRLQARDRHRFRTARRRPGSGRPSPTPSASAASCAAVRTIPVLLDMAHDMERLCPDVLHLNYVNPMAMNCSASFAASRIKTVGLCHSVRHTAEELARRHRRAGRGNRLPRRRREPRRLLPQVRARRAGPLPADPPGDRRGPHPDDQPRSLRLLPEVRLFRAPRAPSISPSTCPGTSSATGPDLIEKFNIPLDEYPRRCVEQIERLGERCRAELKDSSKPIQVRRSVEYGSEIIHSIETGQPRVVYGNVMNNGSIANLPADCCVEVPVLVDRNGLQPTVVGDMPLQLACLMRTQINVQQLTVEAVLTGRRDHVLSRGDARSAHRRRARPRPDRLARRRSARCPWRFRPGKPEPRHQGCVGAPPRSGTRRLLG